MSNKRERHTTIKDLGLDFEAVSTQLKAGFEALAQDMRHSEEEAQAQAKACGREGLRLQQQGQALEEKSQALLTEVGAWLQEGNTHNNELKRLTTVLAVQAQERDKQLEEHSAKILEVAQNQLLAWSHKAQTELEQAQQLQEQTADKLKASAEQLSQREVQLKATEQDLAAAQEHNQQIEAQLLEQTAACRASGAQLKKTEQQLQATKQRFDKSQQSLQEAEGHSQELAAKVALFEKRLLELQNKFRTAVERLASSESGASSLVSKLRMSEEERSVAEVRISELEARVEALTEEQNESESRNSGELNRLRNKLRQAQDSESKQSIALRKEQARLKALEASNDELRTRIESLMSGENGFSLSLGADLDMPVPLSSEAVITKLESELQEPFETTKAQETVQSMIAQGASEVSASGDTAEEPAELEEAKPALIDNESQVEVPAPIVLPELALETESSSLPAADITKDQDSIEEPSQESEISKFHVRDRGPIEVEFAQLQERIAGIVVSEDDEPEPGKAAELPQEEGEEDIEWRPASAQGVTFSELPDGKDEDLEWTSGGSKGVSKAKPSVQTKAEEELTDDDLEWKPGQPSLDKGVMEPKAKIEPELSDEDLEWKPASGSIGVEKSLSADALAKPEIDDDLEWKPTACAVTAAIKPLEELEEEKLLPNISDEELEWKPGQPTTLGPSVAELQAKAEEEARAREEAEAQAKLALEQEQTQERVCELIPFLAEEAHFDTDPPEELKTRIAHGYEYLEYGNFDAAWTLFGELDKEYPNVLQVRKGVFDDFVACNCWSDVVRVGIPIIYAMSKSDGWTSFCASLDKAIRESLRSIRDDSERKKLLFYIAQLHFNDPGLAKRYLNEANQIVEKTQYDPFIHYYLARLATDPADYSFEHIIGALKGVSCSSELFDILLTVSSDKRFRGHLPVVALIEAMYKEPRKKAKELEENTEVKTDMGPKELTQAHVEEIHDDEADSIIEFFFNLLFHRAGVSMPKPSEKQIELLSVSEEVPFGFTPGAALARLCRKFFNFKDLKIKVYKGNERFFIEVVEDRGITFILNYRMSQLSASDMIFIIVRKLFEVHHRHCELWRIREMLTPQLHCELVRHTRNLVCETGTDISQLLEKEIKALSPDKPELDTITDSLLDRLYRQTLRIEFQQLREYLLEDRPFKCVLEGASDRFASRLVGSVDGSYALARLVLGDVPLVTAIEKQGFSLLYEQNKPECEDLCLRLQRLWVSRFDDEIWFVV